MPDWLLHLILAPLAFVAGLVLAALLIALMACALLILVSALDCLMRMRDQARMASGVRGRVQPEKART